MYCSNCGKKAESEWSFCNYCGNKLETKSIPLTDENNISKTIKCKVCDKEIPYNENGTCEECHKKILEIKSIKQETKHAENEEVERNQITKKKFLMNSLKLFLIIGVIISFFAGISENESIGIRNFCELSRCIV